MSENRGRAEGAENAERNGLERQSVGELKRRIELGSALIKELRRDEDPRAAEVIEKLQEQQRVINEVLVRKIREERAARGEEEPEAVVVGMKAVRLRGRAAGR